MGEEERWRAEATEGGASINIGKAPDCLFFQEVVPFMLQLTHLKLNTCSPQKTLAHDQTGLLQVLDFVRDRTCPRSPVQNWGAPQRPCATTYTSPHYLLHMQSTPFLLSSLPGCLWAWPTPQPPHDSLPTPEPHSPSATLHQPSPQKYLTTWLSPPFPLHPPPQTVGATIFPDSSVDPPLVAAVCAGI